MALPQTALLKLHFEIKGFESKHVPAEIGGLLYRNSHGFPRPKDLTKDDATTVGR
jgi:hypothetical protein